MYTMWPIVPLLTVSLSFYKEKHRTTPLATGKQRADLDPLQNRISFCSTLAHLVSPSQLPSSAMYFHSFRPAEMQSPAAKEEAAKIARQQNEHIFLQQNTHSLLQGRTDFLEQLDSSLKRRVAPLIETRKRTRKEKRLLREHEKAVHAELADVMTRASDTMRERIKNGVPGGMYVSAFLTPMQEKLRAGQLAYEKQVATSPAQASAQGKLVAPGSAPRYMPGATRLTNQTREDAWITDSLIGHLNQSSSYPAQESSPVVEKGGVTVQNSTVENNKNDLLTSSKSVRKVFSRLEDLDLGGGASSLQWLAIADPENFGRQLSKVLKASTMMHFESMASLQALCETCEDRASWLTQCHRARLFIFEPEPVTDTSIPAQSSSRLICFRRDGRCCKLDLEQNTSGTDTENDSGIEYAFGGLIPKQNRKGGDLFNAIVEAAESGETISLSLHDARIMKKRSRQQRHVRSPRASDKYVEEPLSWCFPIVDRVDGPRKRRSRATAILVLVHARNCALTDGIFEHLEKGRFGKKDALKVNDIDQEISSQGEYSSDSEGSYGSLRSKIGKRSYSRPQHYFSNTLSKDEAILRYFLQNVAVALENLITREHQMSQLRLKFQIELKRQLEASKIAEDRKSQEERVASERLSKMELEIREEAEHIKRKASEREKEMQRQFNLREEQLKLELEKARTRISEDENLMKLREQELKHFNAELEVEKAKYLVEQQAEKDAIAAEKARIEAEMDRLRSEHQDLLSVEKREHRTLGETEAALAAVKSDLEKQKQENINMSKAMAEKYQHNVVQLEAEVRRHEAEVRRQQKRVLIAKRAALKSNDRLPIALNSLRRMSQIAMGPPIDDRDSNHDISSEAKRSGSELLSAIVETTIGVLEAERATLFLLSQDGTHLWSENLASANLSTTLSGSSPVKSNSPLRIVIDRTAGICGHVATTRQLYNIADVYDDIRFDSTWDKKTGFRTRSMLVCPILNAKGDILGVLQAMNKTTATYLDFDSDSDDLEGDKRKEKTYPIFTKEDEQIIRMLCSHAAMGIEHSQGLHKDAKQLLSAKKLLERTQSELLRHDNESSMLLDAAKDVAMSSSACYNKIDALMMNEDFNNDGAPKVRSLLVPMFERVVAHARRLCRADRASLFFADWEGRRLWSVVAEGVTTASSTSKSHERDTDKIKENQDSFMIELPMGRGVVGRVVESGKAIVTSNARSLPFFDDTHDMSSGYHTQSIVCVPIFGDKLAVEKKGSENSTHAKKESENIVVAALMIINKLDEKDGGTLTNSFNNHDVDLAKTLAVQVSASVMHAQDLMKTMRSKKWLSKKRQEKVTRKIALIEQKGAEALKKIESELQSQVHSVQSRAAKMLNVLSMASAKTAAAGISSGDQNVRKDVSTLLTAVLDQVRDVLSATSVIYHERDFERRLLWPRATSVCDDGKTNRLGKYALSTGQGGTTSLASGGGGNLADAGVAVAIASSNSAAGLETARRACILSGTEQGQILSGTAKGFQSICQPVSGRDDKGKEVSLGVLEAIVPCTHMGSNDEVRTDKEFLASVCAQIGAVLSEEIQAKNRVAGEEQAARAMKELQNQLTIVQHEEASTGKRLKREERLLRASSALANSNKFFKGKHGAIVDLFGRTVKAATSLVGSDRGSLFLVDSDKGVLRTTDTSENKLAEKAGKKHDTSVDFIEIPIKTNSIAGHVALSGEESNIVDAYGDSRFNRSIDKKSGYRTQSLLTIPIFGQLENDRLKNSHDKSRNSTKRRLLSKGGTKQVIAILQLINKTAISETSGEPEITSFTDEDVVLVRRFVEQASPAIRNALEADAQADEVANAHAHIRDMEIQIEEQREKADKLAAVREAEKQAAQEAAKRNLIKVEKTLQIVVEKNAKLEASLMSLRSDNHRLRDMEKDLTAKCEELEREKETLEDFKRKKVLEANQDVKTLRDKFEKEKRVLKDTHAKEMRKFEKEYKMREQEIEEEYRLEIKGLEQQLYELRRQVRDSVDATQLAEIKRDHLADVEALRQSTKKDMAHAKSIANNSVREAEDKLEKVRVSNRDLLSKVSRLESLLDTEQDYTGMGSSRASLAKRPRASKPRQAEVPFNESDAASDADSIYSDVAESQTRLSISKAKKKRNKLVKKRMTKSKNNPDKISNNKKKKKKKKKKKLVVTLNSTSPSRSGNVLLNFGVKNSKTGSVQKYAVSASKVKKKKAVEVSKKKKALATLSASSGGPVTIVVDRKLFSQEAKKKKRVVLHPSPPRLMKQYPSASLYATDVTRLEYGFQPPPTSRGRR